MDILTCAVIVSYNSPAELSKCINSVIDQVNNIIVIDNSTDNSSISDIKAFCYDKKKVSFIFNGKNKGLGYALNQGLSHSLTYGHYWTLLLDQDSVLSENMVREMYLSYENLDNNDREKTAMVVPVVSEIVFKKELPALIFTNNLFSKRIKKSSKDVFVNFHIISGSLVKNKVISKVGLLNETLFIDYIDYDYCFRVLKNGFKILLSKNAVLYHSLAKTKHKFIFVFKEHDPLRVYYQTRNRLFVLSRYGKEYKSLLFEETFRFIGKIFKILLIESDKAAKIKLLLKGIVDYRELLRR